jgi:hypothetical protein
MLDVRYAWGTEVISDVQVTNERLFRHEDLNSSTCPHFFPGNFGGYTVHEEPEIG